MSGYSALHLLLIQAPAGAGMEVSGTSSTALLGGCGGHGALIYRRRRESKSRMVNEEAVLLCVAVQGGQMAASTELLLG